MDIDIDTACCPKVVQGTVTNNPMSTEGKVTYVSGAQLPTVISAVGVFA